MFWPENINARAVASVVAGLIKNTIFRMVALPYFALPDRPQLVSNSNYRIGGSALVLGFHLRFKLSKLAAFPAYCSAQSIK
jgi:hypothetical protein